MRLNNFFLLHTLKMFKKPNTNVCPSILDGVTSKTLMLIQKKTW